MANFTSTLPDNLLKMLSEKAESLSVPKNNLDYLEKAEYIKSHKQAAQDKDIMIMAEEGMADYLNQLKDEAR
jgi:hypothetical protein